MSRERAPKPGATWRRGEQYVDDDPHDWPEPEEEAMTRKTASDITDPELDALYAELDAHLNEPALRNCLMPACLRQFDIKARLCGNEPARPSWSGDGWIQLRLATGYVCPDHAPTAEAHVPQWQRDEDLVRLRCACGWDTPWFRWPAAATAVWQDHLTPPATNAATKNGSAPAHAQPQLANDKRPSGAPAYAPHANESPQETP